MNERKCDKYKPLEFAGRNSNILEKAHIRSHQVFKTNVIKRITVECWIERVYLFIWTIVNKQFRNDVKF